MSSCPSFASCQIKSELERLREEMTIILEEKRKNEEEMKRELEEKRKNEEEMKIKLEEMKRELEKRRVVEEIEKKQGKRTKEEKQVELVEIGKLKVKSERTLAQLDDLFTGTCSPSSKSNSNQSAKSANSTKSANSANSTKSANSANSAKSTNSTIPTRLNYVPDIKSQGIAFHPFNHHFSALYHKDPPAKYLESAREIFAVKPDLLEKKGYIGEMEREEQYYSGRFCLIVQQLLTKPLQCLHQSSFFPPSALTLQNAHKVDASISFNDETT